VNVIDTAINYRCQRSERSVGQALRQLASQGFPREQIVVATKGGFIPFDGEPPANPKAYLQEAFVRNGVLQPAELVAGCHAMTPNYLENQIELSLANLGLECIDIYYLHNPETQLSEVPRPEFHRRLRSAFEFLEGAVGQRKIRFYGTATWNGYRQPPEAEDHLSLEAIVGLAREAAGEHHHFRFLQLPYSLAMSEAFTEWNQKVGEKTVSLLRAAQELGVAVMSSATIHQGRLSRGLPDWLGSVLTGFTSDTQRAIQFARSTPGLTTALVGMKQRGHVEENLAVARQPPAAPEDFLRLFEVEK
jgi:aryl-alcohol dehydrogenase-like predicted oxidoreductase